MDAKEQTQRMNEIQLEAAEILLEQMKGLIKEPDLLVGTVQVADAISKLHITPAPFDPRTLLNGFGEPWHETESTGPESGKGGNLA